MTNRQAERVYIKEGGFIPSIPMQVATSKPLFAQALDVWNSLNRDGYLVKLLEWATPEMGQTIGPGIQKLMVGRTTPQALVKDVEAEHAKFQKSQGG
jgi:raffinose/stachyose/melibiose transport system substrate-binding protein